MTELGVYLLFVRESMPPDITAHYTEIEQRIAPPNARLIEVVATLDLATKRLEEMQEDDNLRGRAWIERWPVTGSGIDDPPLDSPPPEPEPG
jgi:hypothetical protein